MQIHFLEKYTKHGKSIVKPVKWLGYRTIVGTTEMHLYHRDKRDTKPKGGKHDKIS